MDINKFNKWKVTARIIGEKLPIKPITINNCVVEKLNTDEQKKLVLLPSRPKISARGEEECYMSYLASNNKEIVSSYFINVNVSVSNADEAENLARKRFEEISNIISLALNCKNWYEFSLCGINRFINGGLVNVESISSFPVRLSLNVSPQPFSEDDYKKIRNLSKIEDSIFKKSLYYLSLGEKRLNKDLTRQVDRLDTETYLNFFKVIELISNELVKDKDIKIDKNILEGLLDHFKEKYNEVTDAEKQIACIEKYQNEISILKGKYLSEKIKQLDKILNISPAYIGHALEFNKIRNKYDVVHARKSYLNVKIDYSKLSLTTRVFLRRYLEYVSHK